MNDSEEIWNPTRRLYEALMKAKKHGSTMQSNGQHRRIRNVLGQVFGFNPDHTFEIYSGLRALSDALYWTEAKIEESTIKQKGNYTRNFSAVRQSLEIGNIDNNWEAFGRQLTDEAMADLLHAATRLSETHAEVELTIEELGELTSELQSLIDMFHAADIDSELRIAILDLLAAASEVLSEYKIRGGDSLKKIIELTIGRLVTKQSALKQSDPELISKLLDWLKKLDDLYGKLGKYAPLLPKAVGLLLSDKSQ
jgi:hypothetical protein